MFVILLNGPPSSGKDTLANALYEEFLKRKEGFVSLCIYKFAWPIKKPIQAMFELSDEEYELYFETSAKDRPQEKFFGLTPRSVLISLSEDWAKKKFGREIYGRLAGRYLSDKLHREYIIISDCGFEEELQGLFEYVGPKNCGIVRLQREGADYKSDSRNYLSNNQVAFNIVIDNNSDISYAVSDVMTELNLRGFFND